MRALFSTLLSIAIVASVAQRPASTRAAETIYLLKPAQVFDGESAQLHTGWVVLVRGEKIEAVAMKPG